MPIDDGLIAQVAARLRAAHEGGTPIAPVRDELAPGGVDAAYAVQDANTRHALAQGRRLVGRKIGLTSKAVQAQLGVDSPDFGMLFDDMSLRDGDVIAAGKVLQPKAEAEVAFVIEPRPRRSPTSRCAISWQASNMCCLRSRSSAAASATGTSSSSTPSPTTRPPGCSCSATSRARSTASTCACVRDAMQRDGEPVSSGTGAACLGNPLIAALWLARKMARGRADRCRQATS